MDKTLVERKIPHKYTVSGALPNVGTWDEDVYGAWQLVPIPFPSTFGKAKDGLDRVKLRVEVEVASQPELCCLAVSAVRLAAEAVGDPHRTGTERDGSRLAVDVQQPCGVDVWPERAYQNQVLVDSGWETVLSVVCAEGGMYLVVSHMELHDKQSFPVRHQQLPDLESQLFREQGEHCERSYVW